MSSIFAKAQPAVRKESRRVSIITAIGVLLMWAGFLVCHLITPESVPFNYTVILGGLCGGIVAVLNFFMMGLAVQDVASSSDAELARMKMSSSYKQRLLIQVLWIIVAIIAPCFQFAAGIAPLLFPSIGIKLLTVAGKI